MIKQTTCWDGHRRAHDHGVITGRRLLSGGRRGSSPSWASRLVAKRFIRHARRRIARSSLCAGAQGGYPQPQKLTSRDHIRALYKAAYDHERLAQHTGLDLLYPPVGPSAPSHPRDDIRGPRDRRYYRAPSARRRLYLECRTGGQEARSSRVLASEGPGIPDRHTRRAHAWQATRGRRSCCSAPDQHHHQHPKRMKMYGELLSDRSR